MNSPAPAPTTIGGVATTVRLYLIRAVIALVWAGLLVAAVSSTGTLTPEKTIPVFGVVLLILYPLIDVVASLVDARSSRNGAVQNSTAQNATAQLINAAIGVVAAIAIAVAARQGADAILRVFGTWALLTGLIQLILAVIRRRRGTPGQLPMILSGSISAVAGIAFVLMATKSELNLTNLAAYATAGAVFFLVSAWRLRSGHQTAATRADSPAHA